MTRSVRLTWPPTGPADDDREDEKEEVLSLSITEGTGGVEAAGSATTTGRPLEEEAEDDDDADVCDREEELSPESTS